MPPSSAIAEQALGARTLIIIDDEATTGRTFANLCSALLRSGLSHVERLIAVTLTDWSQSNWHRSLPLPVETVSLVHGQWTWTAKPDARLAPIPKLSHTSCSPSPINPHPSWGRLGVKCPIDPLIAPFTPRPGERILVVGSGEYVFPLDRVLERLENAGADVRFSAISRSPIAMGHAIRNAFSFADNYGEGIPNFLYNVEPTAYERILVCMETPRHSLDKTLISALGSPEIIAYEM